MMLTLKSALVILALVFLILGALDIKPQRVNPGWLGLALWLISTFIVV